MYEWIYHDIIYIYSKILVNPTILYIYVFIQKADFANITIRQVDSSSVIVFTNINETRLRQGLEETGSRQQIPWWGQAATINR
jgi:hypothetical protein